MPDKVLIKMKYVEDLFLKVQYYMQDRPTLDELFVFLDTEPHRLRSIAYESASVALGFQGLSNATGKGLDEWRRFYARSENVHSTHISIGLGWALAKAGILSIPKLELPPSLASWMVFDGMGYYCGLFKGRKTVKKQLVPKEIEQADMYGFDQGLGRRLWYISKGEVKEVVNLIQAYSIERQADLWRGVGIACGYVGGNSHANLEALAAASGSFRQQLSTGMALMAMGRSLEYNRTIDIGDSCEIVCGMTLDEIDNLKKRIANRIDTGIQRASTDWLMQLEETFASAE